MSQDIDFFSFALKLKALNDVQMLVLLSPTW